jgi:hypothetical protein
LHAAIDFTAGWLAWLVWRDPVAPSRDGDALSPR